MYITSALQKTDMKAVGLQLALDLLHEKVSFKLDDNSFLNFKGYFFSGKTRFNYWVKNSYECWSSELG